MTSLVENSAMLTKQACLNKVYLLTHMTDFLHLPILWCNTVARRPANQTTEKLYPLFTYTLISDIARLVTKEGFFERRLA